MNSFAVHERVSVRVFQHHQTQIHRQLQDVNLALVAVVAPLILMVAINMVSVRSFWDGHTSWLGGILSLYCLHVQPQ